MKKVLSIMLILMLMLPLIPQGIISLNTSAATYGDLTYTISNGEITITDCKETATEVVVPSTIEGYPVTSIGEKAFYECRNLISIAIPDSVTSIGTWAFFGCQSLTNINIPDGVTSIAERVFSGCKSLTSVDVPDSVISIDGSSFFGCENLTSIDIPDSVISIGAGAFIGCGNLTSISIPHSVTNIGKKAFYWCRRLATVHYFGTEADKSNMYVDGDGNDYLLNAEWIYYAGDTYINAGDFDGDGVITVSDALAALRIAAKMADATAKDLEIGDMDKDGNITVSDALAILRIAAKLDVPGNPDEPSNNIELKDFNASHFDIYIGTTELVTFSVEVYSDTTLPDSVSLYEEESVIAEMTDKGTNGDLVANDGIYTSQVTLSKSEIENISYHASYYAISSNTFEICYYRDLTQNEFVLYSQLINNINQLSFEEAKNYIISSNEILYYIIDEDNEKITYKSIYGISGIWEQVDDLIKGNGEFAIPSPEDVDYETVYNDIITSIQNGTKPTLPSYPNANAYSQALNTVSNIPFEPAISNTDVVVLRPFRSSEFTYDDFSYTGQIISEGMGGSLTVIDDESVSLSVMKSLDQYGVVLIDSHGGISDIYKKTYVVTGESFDETRFLLDPIYYAMHIGNSADYLADRIFGTGANRVGVSSKFFDKYYADNSLEEAFWFLGSCYSFYNDTLADTLIGKGADAVVGFTNPVSVWYCNNILFETVINSMMLSANTLAEAISNAGAIYGDNDPLVMAKNNTLTKIKYKGNSSFKLMNTIQDPETEADTYNGHEYELIDESMTWQEAKRYCESKGGYLAVISSSDENQFISDLISERGSKNCYWIGTYRDASSNVWKNVTGEKVDYTNWSRNEPNNEDGIEFFVHIYGKGYIGGTGIYHDIGEWNDVSENGASYAGEFYAQENFGFICEYGTSVSVETPRQSLISKYGLASQEQFVSCLGSEIQSYPSDIYGIVSMVDLDINNDKIDELVVLRVSQTNNIEKAHIIAEVYQTTNGNPYLCASKTICDVSYCTASNIYLFYSDILREYCIVVDSYSRGAYTGVNWWSAKVYTITSDSIAEYGNWEFVPGTVYVNVDFESEFKAINAPYAKYCDTFDNRNTASYYQPLCEVEHELFGDLGSYMTRNHKLKINSIT